MCCERRVALRNASGQAVPASESEKVSSSLFTVLSPEVSDHSFGSRGLMIPIPPEQLFSYLLYAF